MGPLRFRLLHGFITRVINPRLAWRREDGAAVLSRWVWRPDAVLLHEDVGEHEALPHYVPRDHQGAERRRSGAGDHPLALPELPH